MDEEGARGKALDSHGVTGSRLDENHEILYFQSNYFTQPKKLFLRGKSIRALDKDDLSVIVDIEQERIHEGPANLVLDQVIKTSSGKEKELYFLLKTNPEYDEKRGFSIFPHEFTDARGNSFNTGVQSIRSHSDNPGYDQTLVFSLPDNQSYQSPITFRIQDYPSRIIGEFDIRIK